MILKGKHSPGYFDIHLEELHWFRDNNPTTTVAQSISLLYLIRRFGWSKPIAKRLFGSDVIYWVREDYYSCGEMHPYEYVYIIPPNGKWGCYHGHPKWVHRGKLEYLIEKIKASGPYNKAAIEKARS